MNPSARLLVAEFEAAATVVQAEEEKLRKSLAEQIARLERTRAFAFRRTRLIRVLATNCEAEATTHEDVWPVQRRAVREELGWTGASEAHDAILERLQPLAQVIWQRVHHRAGDDEEEDDPPAVAPELEAFEAWFQEKHGKPFYVVFDQYVQEVPVVDF